MKVKINEKALRKIISEAIENTLYGQTTHDVLSRIEEKAESIIDYLYNEGVVAYDDQHLAAMAKDMSRINFKDICKEILYSFDGDISDEEKGALQRYLKTGSYPELEDHIYRAVVNYEKKAHEFFNDF